MSKLKLLMILTGLMTVGVNAAITLERPLLVKGEPGTGKTRLAEEVALTLAGQGIRRRFAGQSICRPEGCGVGVAICGLLSAVFVTSVNAWMEPARGLRRRSRARLARHDSIA